MTWRLDGRAPQFHLYKEDSPNPDSGSIRTDLPLFSRCSEGPDSDVITNATTRGKRKLRRARKKFRKRSSRCDLSSSSDSDERSFGLNEDDIDRYLAQSSLEYPGNIPIVISSTCILYQTTLSGCQEEIPLQLGLIVNAIFKKSLKEVNVKSINSSLEYPGNIPIVICSTCILYQTTLSGCQEEIPLQLGLIVNAIFKTLQYSDRQKCSSSELCVSLQSKRMDSYQNLKSVRNEPSLPNVDFSFQYNWEPIREPFLNINSVHHREFNKQSKQKQGFEDKKFKTIEIMKDPSATLGRKTNRVKKPCFKIHNKLETKTNPKEGVDNKLEHIAENEPTEQVTPKESESPSGKRDKILEHIAENEPTEQVTPKESESPSGKRDKINSNINNSSRPKDETPKPQTKTASPTCEHQQLDNVTKRTANNRQDNVIQTSANIFRSKSEVSRKVDTLSTASYPLRKKVSKIKHATSTDNISLCSEKTIDDLFLKYKQFRGLFYEVSRGTASSIQNVRSHS
ncbi:uncharacterized protein LOC113467083 [Diaphorina citri]|uniref:Uncharacterized protein LOC113467083 n=1 Tax=Diaphorina citri TaxID=121845 RepID=A0A3Q0IRF8_DIACI|nr:uncharacterized protein LOC113467083 [Diaphorina citri]